MIDIQLGFNEKKYRANTLFHHIYPNQYEETKAYLVSVKGKFGPYACIITPALSCLINWILSNIFDYKVGYETLIVNRVLTALGLNLFSIKKRCK